MTTSYTQNAHLQKPATADRNWDLALNANTDFLDGVAAIGRLLVTKRDEASDSLDVRVSSGAYARTDGTIGYFPGVSAYALPASDELCLWLDDAGLLVSNTSFPETVHVRLARVTTDQSAVRSILDERIAAQACGAGAGFVSKTGDQIAGNLSVVSPTDARPALVVQPNPTAIGFFGAPPSGPAASISPIQDDSMGIPADSVVSAGPTYSRETIDANVATIVARLNAILAALKLHGLMSS